MFKKNNLFFILLCFFCFSKNAHAILSVDIDSGRLEEKKVLVIGLNKGNDEESYIIDIIKNDLNHCGFFHVYFNNQSYFEENELREQNFNAFIKKNLSFVVSVDLRNDSKTIYANYKIWNVNSKKLLFEKSIRFQNSLIRTLAHNISDDVYLAGTGFSGYFNTKIFYIAETGSFDRKIKRLAKMDYDGFNNQFLTDGRFLILTPRISSDNSKILYVSYEKRIPRVFMFDLQRMKHIDLLEMPGISSAPRFAFYNNDLILTAVSSSGHTDIFKFDLKKNISKQLTKNQSINTSPSYSPDNHEIIFSSDRLGKGNSQIFLMRSDGFDQRRISNGQGKYFNPIFSPNGEYIAFTKLLKGNFYIGIMKKNGSEEKILAGGYMLESPCWAPNGKLIAFSSTSKENKSSIYMVDISGKFHKKVEIVDKTINAIDPMWGG